MNWKTIKSILQSLEQETLRQESLKAFMVGSFERKYFKNAKPTQQLLQIKTLSEESGLYEVSISTTVDEGSHQTSKLKSWKALYNQSNLSLSSIKGGKHWVLFSEQFKLLCGNKEYRRRYGR